MPKLTDDLKEAVRDDPNLPSSRREALIELLYQGGVVGIMVLVMEYAIFNPIWTYVVQPVVARMTR